MFSAKLFLLGLFLFVLRMAFRPLRQRPESFAFQIRPYQPPSAIVGGKRAPRPTGMIAGTLPLQIKSVVRAPRPKIHPIVKTSLAPFRVALRAAKQVPKPPSFSFNPKFLSPMEFQGECGCCWAFAVCQVLAHRVGIQTGGYFNKNLSVQTLLECYNPTGCDGGSPELAAEWLAKTNTFLPLSGQNPYRQQTALLVSSPCLKTVGVVGVAQVYSLAEFIPEVGYSPEVLRKNVENMKNELLTNGPFFCAMAVYSDFFEFSGLGVYRRSPDAVPVGGHAIEVIGYCERGVDTRPEFRDVGYWICRNSWNDWPRQSDNVGYFAIEMGVNMCGVESRCGGVVALSNVSAPANFTGLDMVL